MSGDHDHSHGRGASRRALARTLALTATYTVVEVIGALFTGSLALLADAGHMLSDSVSIGLALVALWLADRPPTATRSFGYKRAEILAALLNGLTLVGISIYIFIEAYGRFADPPEVLGGWLLAVAVVGLLVNVGAFAILQRGSDDSLNVTAAVRHVLADLLGSIGVIVAAIVILLTGWREADPVIGALIGVLVLVSAWPIVRDSVRVLLEAAPQGLDVERLGMAMAAVDGVEEVHDLHVWTITSGFPALSAHVVVGRDEDCHARRRELEGLLERDFDIEHTTLQVDHEPELVELDTSEQREAPRFGGDAK